jgi:predicted acylesterase/phospholipase RssA
MTPRELHAVVLSGGGAYAAYEVGVMKALFSGLSPATGHAPIDPKIVTGTSAGAFNAAFIVSQAQADGVEAVRKLEEIWMTQIATESSRCPNAVARYRLDPFVVFDPSCLFRNPLAMAAQVGEDLSFIARDWTERALQFGSSDGPIEERLAKLIDLSTLFADNLGKLISRLVGFTDIPESPRALRIAATNWTTGSLRVYRNEDMSHGNAPLYIKASAAIPGVFPPVVIDGEAFVDGGVVMNTPLAPAIDAGATTLHVIYMDPDISKIPLHRLRNTLDTVNRLWVIQNAQSLNLDIDMANSINRGIELVHAGRAAANPSPDDWAALLSLASKLSPPGADLASRYRHLTIHKYHPDDDLGGIFGFLRFDHSTVGDLIQRGFLDAISHDCRREECAGVQFTDSADTGVSS